MRPLRPGQDTVLSWKAGAIDCRVIAAAGAFVLLRPERISAMAQELPAGSCSLTFLDGMIPMGWDGHVEFGSEPGELRFRANGVGADRRSSVRLPIFADVSVTVDGRALDGQLLDVSAGGMRFRVPERLELRSVIHLRAHLPGGGPVIDAEATVRSSEPGIAAVEYLTMQAATAQDIGTWTVAQLRSSLAGRG